jgi:carboxymethylenebutenolidase
MQDNDLRQHLHSLHDSPWNGQRQPTRRAALGAALGVGYAAATMPLAAQTIIRTPADGLVAGPVSFRVNGFEVPAYRAAPAGRSKLPVVLVVQEIFGVHEHIADVARRFARAGYLAIAPQLYERQGNPAAYTDNAKLMSEIVSKVPDRQVLADLDGALLWAAANGGDRHRAAVTGFCWGGRIAWLYAAHTPVRAAVAWYGRLVGQASELTPEHPLQVADRLKAPVLGLYGSEDRGIPVATIAQMQEALRVGSDAAKRSRFSLFKGAPHAFHADYRPTYRQQPATEGWAECLAWFKANGAV